MSGRLNLVGNRYGRLRVIALDHCDSVGVKFWRCKCDCGNETVKRTRGLTMYPEPSCGCHRRELISKLRTKNWIGLQFGFLKVIDQKPGKHGTMCLCECVRDGNRIWVYSGNLTSGDIRSCGCYAKEVSSRVHKKWNSVDEIRLSKILDGMKQRCCNPTSPSYRNYGARGICVCDEWLNDPKAFVDWSLANGYKVGLSIDRINNDGPYAPWNCRWVNQQIQANNTRVNVYLTVNGEVKTLKDWARRTHVSYKFLWRRFHRDGQERTEELLSKLVAAIPEDKEDQ